MAARGSHVAGLADVVEGQHGAPGADPDPLDDPLVSRADVELFQEAVGDLAVRVEMPDAVQVKGHLLAHLARPGPFGGSGMVVVGSGFRR